MCFNCVAVKMITRSVRRKKTHDETVVCSALVSLCSRASVSAECGRIQRRHKESRRDVLSFVAGLAGLCHNEADGWLLAAV